MADEFVDLELETDGAVLTDNAVLSLQDEWDGYTPNDGDMEVVLLETVGDMAGDVAADASRMPSEALIQFGVTMLGVPHDDGLAATALVTMVLVDDAGHIIPAGFTINIDGYDFQTLTETVFPPGDDTEISIVFTALDPGTEANDLTGEVVDVVTASTLVESVDMDAGETTSGGTEAETRESYIDKVSLELQLRGRTLVTWRDYEKFAVQFSPLIARAVAVGNEARQVTVALIGPDGLAVSSGIKTDLAAFYAEFRQVNTIYSIVDANYTVVTVVTNVKAYPGFDLADLSDRVEAALYEALSPDSWGRLTYAEAPTSWQNEPVVRANKLIDLIASVQGVNYVQDILIGSTSTQSVTATASTDVFQRADAAPHGLMAGAAVKFTGMTGGGGIVDSHTYYVLASGLTATAFKIGNTPTGSALDVSSNLTAGTMTPVAVADNSGPLEIGDLAMRGPIPLPTPGLRIAVAT